VVEHRQNSGGQNKGDVLLRKSRNWGFVALAALTLTLPCLLFIRPLWQQFATLGTGSFMLAAGAWAMILAAGPILIIVGALCSLFLRVEAYFAPRSHKRTFLDTVVVGLAILISFAPALTALYPPCKALQTGVIGFQGPGQEYPLLTDPYGYWQAIAFWFMGATSLGFLAAVYWRAKWRQSRPAKAPA